MKRMSDRRLGSYIDYLEREQDKDPDPVLNLVLDELYEERQDTY